jgi:hypothetical protein
MAAPVPGVFPEVEALVPEVKGMAELRAAELPVTGEPPVTEEPPVMAQPVGAKPAAARQGAVEAAQVRPQAAVGPEPVGTRARPAPRARPPCACQYLPQRAAPSTA